MTDNISHKSQHVVNFLLYDREFNLLNEHVFLAAEGDKTGDKDELNPCRVLPDCRILSTTDAIQTVLSVTFNPENCTTAAIRTVRSVTFNPENEGMCVKNRRNIGLV